MDLTEFKNQHQILDLIKFDSTIHRYSKPHQKSPNSWYIGFNEYKNGKEHKILVVGDWTMGDERFIWSSNGGGNNLDKDILKKIEQARQLEQENKDRRNAKAAIIAQKILSKALQCYEKNPYFERKQITSSLGAFFGEHKNKSAIFIPMKNQKGALTSLQIIDYEGNKKFLPGGKIKGSYHLVGEETKTLYVCEGFATAASIHYATKKQVAVCFMASNIEAVALSFKDKRHVVICADNDKFHDATKSPNAGLKIANKIYQEHKIEFVYPSFKDESSKPTDFNDLYCLEGIDEVKNQIQVKDKSVCEFLGYDDSGYYFYSDRSKMIKCLSLSQMKQGALVEMAPEIYWAANYFTKSQKEPDLCDWVRTIGKVIDEQQKIGKFNIERVKGLGSWIDSKKHVIHLGDKLLVDFKPVQISDFKGKNFYYPAKEIQLNWEKQDFDFSALIEASKLIDFKTEADRICFIGFIAQSPIFTTQRWRSNVWLNAPKGSGKSILLEFLSELCINSLFVQDTTAAGIRQKAKYDSKTILYDEAEGEQYKTKQVLEMARTCSSSGGSQVLRGTVAGRSMSHSNDFIFCFASIRQPNFTTADDSRITTIRLMGNEDRKGIDNIVKGKERSQAMLRAVELGPDIFIFLNKNLKKFEETRKSVTENLQILNLTNRQADQLSGLLAGYILISNEDIEAVVNRYYLSAKDEVEDQEKDSDNLLGALKDVMIRNSGEDIPIGRLMYFTQKYISGQTEDGENIEKMRQCAETLGYYGIKYHKQADYFSLRSNVELKRLFAQKTIYQDIYRSLKTINGVRYDAVKIGKSFEKRLIIPSFLLF